jgi:hypothetical protein
MLAAVKGPTPVQPCKACYSAQLVVVRVMHCRSFEGRLLNDERQVQTSSSALCLIMSAPLMAHT